MIIIGLTGGFGSGKSTVAGMLRELGARVIDADKVAHQLYQPGTPAFDEVVRAFGREIVGENGEIDRRKLGQKVFGNPQALRRLNAILHPRISDRVIEILEVWRGEGVKVAVVEAALLIEAGWGPLVDRVWVTVASEARVKERLRASKDLTDEEIEARLASQMPVEDKAKRADVVISTDGSLDQVREEVERQWRRLA
ncbi:MAG: dephospho-CoA kinase [Chloroflexi bacterium]|nr:dephospho-CoA kinase [Chloroflexota bacterium]